MKKLLLFVIACTLGLFATVNAQETVLIGYDDCDNKGYNPPIDVYESYYLSQQIFPADSINIPSGSVISKIAFKKHSGGKPTRNWSIYMTNSETGTFSFANWNAATMPVTSSDMVYSGSFDIPEGSDVWVSFDLNGFTYTGGDLILTIADNTGSGAGDMTWHQNFIGTSVMNKISSPYTGESYSFETQTYPYTCDIQLTFAAAGEGGEGEGGEGEGGEELASEFSFDFNDGTLDGWRVFHGEGSNGPDWANSNGESYFYGEGNTNSIYSMSLDGWTNYSTVNNYIVTTSAYQITTGSKLSWFMTHTYYSIADVDKYEVVVSENGEDFQMIWEGNGAGNNNQEISLAEYAGKNLYIGFRHYCVDPQGGDAIVLDNIVLTAGEGGGEEPTPEPEPETPVVDLTKQYRVKATSSGKYLYVENNVPHESGTTGGVIVAQALNDDAQLFTLEDAGDGAYYFKSATGYYIYCQAWNVDAYSTTEKTALKLVDQGDGTFSLQNTNNNKYFKVQQVGMFYYTFCDCDGVDCTIETWTLEAVETPEPTPVAPATPVVEATVTETTVTLTWTAVEGATYYNIYTPNNYEGSNVYGLEATTYTFEGLTAGTEYCFEVSAVNDVDESEATKICAKTTEAPVAPEAPINVVATANGQNSIIVTWDPVDGATDYYVYKDSQLWANTSGAQTYTANDLTAGQEYCFAVQAVVGSLESELSEEVCETTEAEPTPEPLPENQVLVGEATANYLTPFVTALGNNTWVEMIYKAEEIGKAGRIAELAYSYNNGDVVTADINIYFVETTKSEFAHAADLTPVTDLTLVYSGTGVTLCDSEWETFVLNTPFNYSGENNLLVVVTTSNQSSLGYNYWNCYNGESNTVLIKDTPLKNQKPVMLLTLAEGGETPEPTPTFTHRLESVACWGVAKYIYDEEETNKVVAVVEDEIPTEISYNEEGQIVSANVYGEDVDENDNPIKVVVSGVEYEYDENGVWTSYTETLQDWMGRPYATTTELGYDAEGRLVSLTSDGSYVRTIAYNEAGLISEVLEGYAVIEEEDGTEEDDDEIIEPDGVESLSETEVEYESKTTFEYDTDGRLVKSNYYGYDAYETKDFYLDEVEAYEYDENGNCVAKRAYSVVEDEDGNFGLNTFPYSVTEYFYDLTIENEDVYSFEYPHFAFINYVEPSYVNVLTKEYSFMSYYDEELDEILNHSYEVIAYGYNPEILSAPLTPMNLTAEVMSATEVELAWAGFPDAETFTLYQGENVLISKLEDPYYTVENLEIGVEYTFSVVAVNEVGVSTPSNTVTVKIELPAAPANLVAKATSDTTIDLTWEAVEGIWSYNIYSVVESEGETAYDIVEEEVWGTEYTVKGLKAATEYSFVVKSVNNVGESLASNVATDTTFKAEEDEPVVPVPTVPAAPANLVAEATSDTTIVLTWEKVEGALSYNVYQGADSIDNVTDTTYTVTGLTANTEYTFTVEAVNEVGKSEASKEAKAKTLEATPEEPGEGIAENAAAFNIYPNPASGRVVIETEATIEEVTIYTITGVMVYSEVDFNDNTVNVSDFANGVYVMKVRTDNGESFQRFIKK